MKKITLLFFTLCTSFIFAQTTIGESSLFIGGPNETWTHIYVANTTSDGNMGEEVIFKINITSLPTGGANYRVYQTTVSGGNSWGATKALSLGSQTIYVASATFNRAVKIQFSSGSSGFNSIVLNGVTKYVGTPTVDQEYLVNPGVNSAATADPNGAGIGNGNFPANLGGWTGGVGGAYASASATNGDCHSLDRMFKFNRTGGTDGHYVFQDVEDLPAGNFNLSFWTKWGALVTWAAVGDKTPTFTILTDDDADGTWEVVKTIITTQPTAADTWVEQTDTFENDYPRNVRIRFHKDGGSVAAPSNLNQTMYIDDVSLKYDSEITYDIDDTTLADLTIDGAIITGFLPDKINYDIELGAGTTVVPTVAATTNNTSATAAITAATSIPGTTTILITAEDGATTNIVSINFSLPALGVVGQEYLVNPNINTTVTSPDTGVNGGGNMPANLGGWTGGVGGAYAPASTTIGDCHSSDRMFKFNKNGGAAGMYVFQDVEDLPAGNFNWSFYTRWGALVDYNAGDAEKPTFTILTDDDADGTWEVVKTIITTQPTVANTWVQQTGTFENDTPRDVRIKFYKNGGNLNQLMFIDDVSLKFVGSNAWTGATGTDWDTATNWSNGVPDASSEVSIPGGLSNYPTASSAVTVSSLTMGLELLL